MIFDTWNGQHDAVRVEHGSFIEALKTLVELDAPAVIYTERHIEPVNDTDEFKRQLKRSRSGFYHDVELRTLADVITNIRTAGSDRVVLVADEIEYALMESVPLLFVASSKMSWKLRFYCVGPLKPNHEFEITYDAYLYSTQLRYELASSPRISTASHDYHNGYVLQ